MCANHTGPREIENLSETQDRVNLAQMSATFEKEKSGADICSEKHAKRSAQPNSGDFLNYVLEALCDVDEGVEVNLRCLRDRGMPDV